LFYSPYRCCQPTSRQLVGRILSRRMTICGNVSNVSHWTLSCIQQVGLWSANSMASLAHVPPNFASQCWSGGFSSTVVAGSWTVLLSHGVTVGGAQGQTPRDTLSWKKCSESQKARCGSEQRSTARGIRNVRVAGRGSRVALYSRRLLHLSC